MRLFNRGGTPEDDPAQPSNGAAAEDTAQPPESTVDGNNEPPAEPVAQDENGEPTGDLYDENGQPLYENDDGSPYDPEGRLNREPEPPEPEKPKPTWRSPFSDQLLTEAERKQAEELVSPEVMPLIETIAARVADRVVASREQSRLAARDAGIPEDLAARIGAYEQYVPADIRGTKKGTITAALMAVAAEAHESENLEEAIGRYFTTAPAVLAPPKTVPRSAAAAVMTTPRANSEGIRPGTRRMAPKNESTKSFAKDGMDGEAALATIIAERKSHAIR